MTDFPDSTTAVNAPQTTPGKSNRDRQGSYLQLARTSLKEAIARHTHRMRAAGSWSSSPVASGWQRQVHLELQGVLKSDVDRLTAALDKLDQGVIRIATFGLVSRGKSAVLNALLGQKVFQTGPINGVTQWPRSVRWIAGADGGKVQIEVIDTPGLDEVEGQTRAEMAREVVDQADLILFVVAGDITRTEYQALCQLREAQKPLILVFNKIDLYPDQDRQAIYRQLQQLGKKSASSDRLQQLLSPEEIVLVAAEPMPLQVRVEWLDGRVTQEWETPPPQITALQEKILSLLNREGRALLALNALRQARQAETAIARKTVQVLDAEADTLIWKFARYKAIAIALNPVAFFDLVGGMLTDLALIRALAKLYGLPMTSYEAGKLWKTILLSSGGLLLGELGSGLLLGLGKSGAAIAGTVDSATGITAYLGVAAAQAGLSGYGAYVVGQAAQVYLEQGCTWGPQGANTIIRQILNQVDAQTIVHRLQQDLIQE